MDTVTAVAVAPVLSIDFQWLSFQWLQWLLFQWLQWVSFDRLRWLGGCRSIDSGGCVAVAPGLTIDSSGCRSIDSGGCRFGGGLVAVVPVAPVAASVCCLLQ